MLEVDSKLELVGVSLCVLTVSVFKPVILELD